MLVPDLFCLRDAEPTAQDLADEHPAQANL